jgi:hypothetical protein
MNGSFLRDDVRCEFWKQKRPYWGRCCLFGANCSTRQAKTYGTCPLYQEYMRRTL